MKIYSTSLGKKTVFTPIRSDNVVSFYLCGITPYDSPHLGHAVTAIRAEMVRRYLAFKGYDVRFVRNVTDVEDKIITRAKERGVDPLILADTYLREYQDAMFHFGISNPQDEPRVSLYINEIIEYISDLVKKGAAYVTESGDIYFNINGHPEYGKLSGRQLDELEEGTREVVREEKRHPLDFALWKRSDDSVCVFDSPWGKGRPGWHIECSVMANKLLGPHIDIHGGGLDLLFPHHENELAQCEAHNDSKFVNFWLHFGLLQVEGTKMSKSLGNYISCADALNRYGAQLVVFATMRHHYRSPISFSHSVFDQLLNQLVDLYWSLEVVEEKLEGSLSRAAESTFTAELIKKFTTAMDNDFSAPEAVVLLVDAVRDCKNLVAQNRLEDAAGLVVLLRKLGHILLLFPKDYNYQRIANETLAFRSQDVGLPVLTLSELTCIREERAQARAFGDYPAADSARSKVLPYRLTILDGDLKGWRFDSRA